MTRSDFLDFISKTENGKSIGRSVCLSFPRCVRFNHNRRLIGDYFRDFMCPTGDFYDGEVEAFFLGDENLIVRLTALYLFKHHCLSNKLYKEF